MSLSYRFPTTTTTQSSPEEAAFNGGCSSSNSDLAAQAGLAVDAAVASSWFDEMVGGASESDFFTNTAGALDAATPAAIAITGTPDWYYARHDDAEARLAGEGLTPPSYYLDYGGKYCTAFTKDLRPKLSPEGQAWCDATALALQDAIESHRAADPLGYVTLEKDDAAFTKFAFETHPDAYLNSGLDELAQGTCCSSGPRRRSPTSWVQAGSCRWSTLGCGSSRCGRRSLASSTRKTLRRSTGCSSTRTPRSSGRSRRDTSLQRSSRGRSSRSSTGCSAMARWCDCSTKRASSCKTAPRARRTPLDGCWSSKA